MLTVAAKVLNIRGNILRLELRKQFFPDYSDLTSRIVAVAVTSSPMLSAGATLAGAVAPAHSSLLSAGATVAGAVASSLLELGYFPPMVK